MIDDPSPTTPPPGGQPQALTDGACLDCGHPLSVCEHAAQRLVDPMVGFVQGQVEELTAQLDEARSEVMRLEDNDSAYDLGFRRATWAAGATIARLLQERDEARARLDAVEAERDQAVEALDEQIRRLQVAIEQARDFPCPECGHRLVVACAHGVCPAAELAPPAPTAGGEGRQA